MREGKEDNQDLSFGLIFQYNRLLELTILSNSSTLIFSPSTLTWIMAISELVTTKAVAQIACSLMYDAYDQNLPANKILTKMKANRYRSN